MSSLIPPALSKALQDERCVLMLGAGVSIGEGLPSASGLCDVLLEEMSKHAPDHYASAKASKGNLSKIATIYGDCFSGISGRQKIVDVIEAKERKAESIAHADFAQIPTIRNIVTTNWDTLMENALDVSDRVVVRNPEDFAGVGPERTTVIKMHGCRTDAARIVLDFADYSKFTEERSAFADEIRSLLRKFTFVCVGYGLEDSNFAQLVEQAIGTDVATNPHFFVLPGESHFQTGGFRRYGFQHIQADAREFGRALRDRFRENAYGLDSARVGSAQLSDSSVASDSNPFEMFDTESLASEDPEKFVQYFIEPADFATICGKGNVVVEGHRGSGKTMAFRYLSMYHDHTRAATLPFWGFYVKLNNAFFDPYPRLREGDEDAWGKRFHHYYNLVVASGILSNLSAAIDNDVVTLAEEAVLVSKIRTRLLRIDIGDFGDNLKGLTDQMICELDSLRNDDQYSGFTTGQDFVRRMLELLSEYCKSLREKRWLVFLDEWDNLRGEQQQALVMRLHDRDENLRYKIAVKTLCFVGHDFEGNAPDEVHDFESRVIDHCLFEESTKNRYFEFLRDVSRKRLELTRTKIKKIDELLPTATKPPKHGYDYSGFDAFAMLSGGLVREFLELCKDAIYLSQPEIATRAAELKPVPAKWQNHVARIHAAIHYNNHRNCVQSEDIQKLLFVAGSTFRAIDRVTRSQKENRKPLTLVITDQYNLAEYEQNLLLDAVRKRLLQLPDRPLQPRGEAEGPQQKYTIHRLMCPKYGIDVNERYSVPIKAKDVEQIWDAPHDVIRSLTNGYRKKGVGKYLPPETTPLLQGMDWKPNDED